MRARLPSPAWFILAAPLLAGCGVGPWAYAALGIAGASGGGGGGGDSPPSTNLQSSFVRSDPSFDPNAVLVDYLLLNDDGGNLDVLVQYSTDGGATYEDCTERAGSPPDPASEGRTALASSPAGIPHRFVWDAKGDLGSALARASLRVVPIEDGTAGFADVSPEFLAANDLPEVLVTPLGTVEGNAVIAFALRDTSGDTCSIAVQVSTDGVFPELPTATADLARVLADDPPGSRALYHLAAVVQTPETRLAASSEPAGASHIFVWNSKAAPPEGVGPERADGVTLRLTPFDYERGSATTTAAFVADNNSNPTVILRDPTFGFDHSFEIPIGYVVRDFESNPVDVVVQFAPGGEDFEPLPEDPAALRAILADPVSATAHRIATPAKRIVEAPLQRRTGLDPLGQVCSDAFVREGLSFLQAGVPFIIGKEIEVFQGPTALGKRAVASFDPATGTVTLNATLTAAPDLAEPGVLFRLNAAEGTRGLATTPAGVDRIFLWDSAADITDPSVTTARIRLIPIDSEVGFEARTDLPFPVENGPVESITVPSTGRGPRSFAAFSLGGKQCLAVVNGESDDLDLFEVAPTHDFIYRETIALAAPNPDQIVAGDIDGDGDADLAVTYRDWDFVTILRQESNGTLAPHEQDGLATGGIPLTQPPAPGEASTLKYESLMKRAVALGDVNGDGRKDLLIANPLNDSVSVFLQRYDGRLGVAQLGEPDAVLLAGDSPQDMTIGDIDADGDNDVAILNLLSHEIVLYEQQDLSHQLVARPNAPSPRTRATLTCADFGGRSALVLFGGEKTGTQFRRLNDTREYTGAPRAWTPTRAEDPPFSRERHAAAFDPDRQKVVLFGGRDLDEVRRGDTWTYDGSGWTLVTPTASPSARDDHAMAFFSGGGLDKVLLFGGNVSIGGKAVPTNDLWSFDGGDWAEVSPAGAAPTARSNHALAFDAARGVLVLFGGVGADGKAMNDTWEFDGASWTQKFPSNPPTARLDHGMVFHGDAKGGVVLLFGGTNENRATLFADTWTYDGTQWKLVTPTASPPARYDHAMAYDPENNLTVVFSGSRDATIRNTHRDQWEWDGLDWTEVPLEVLETGAAPTSLVAADLDGVADGNARLDLVSANYIPDPFDRGGENVTVFRQDSAEAWHFSAEAPLATEAAPYGLAAGTLEGALTVVATNSEAGSLSLYRYDSSTGLLAPSGRLGVGEQPLAAGFADMNGNGVDDLIVANADGNVLSYFAQGPAALGGSLSQVASLATVPGPTEVVSGDLTGDGRPDIVVTGLGGSTSISYVKQDATGRFVSAGTLLAGNQPFGVAVGDLDGDGANDLAIACAFPTVDITGDGVPDVSAIRIYRQGAGGTLVPHPRSPLFMAVGTGTAAVINAATDVVIGDVTGDGRPDLVVADAGAQRVLVYAQQPDGTLGLPPTSIFSLAPLREIKIGDVNSDGRTDIVGISFYEFYPVSLVFVFTQRADGSFAPMGGLPPPIPGGQSTESYYVPVGDGSIADPRNLTLGDLNADGRMDAVTANPGDGSVTIFLQAEVIPGLRILYPQEILGMLGLGTPTPVAAGAVPRGAGIGDFDRDGFLDLATLQNDRDLLNLQLCKSGGSFFPSYEPQPGLTTDRQPVFAEIRDLNGDGRVDAAVTAILGGRLGVFLQR